MQQAISIPTRTNPGSGKFRTCGHDVWVEFIDETPRVHFSEPKTSNEVCYFPKGQEIPAEWMQSKFFSFKVY
jgi:hypothetical protein